MLILLCLCLCFENKILTVLNKKNITYNMHISRSDSLTRAFKCIRCVKRMCVLRVCVSFKCVLKPECIRQIYCIIEVSKILQGVEKILPHQIVKEIQLMLGYD